MYKAEREILARKALKQNVINMLEMYSFIRASKTPAYFRAEDKIKTAIKDGDLEETLVDESALARKNVEQVLKDAEERSRKKEEQELKEKSYKNELPQPVSAIVFTFGSWLKGSGLKMKNLAGQEVGFTSCLIELSTSLCKGILKPVEVSKICELIHFPNAKQCSDYSSPFKAQKIFKHMIKIGPDAARSYFEKHFSNKTEITDEQIEKAIREADGETGKDTEAEEGIQTS